MKIFKSSRNNEKLKYALKYSNNILFTHREKSREFSPKSKIKTLSNFTEFKKSLPMLTQTTFPNSFRNDSVNTGYNPILTQTNFTEFLGDTFYITETKKKHNKCLTEGSSFNENVSFRKEDQKKENEGIKILKIFEKKLISKSNGKKSLLDLKRHKCHRKENVNDYINKTRDIILLNFSMKSKKESSIRLYEKYTNEIEAVEDIINGVRKASNLFNQKFLNKLTDYVKDLELKKEIEKNQNSDLNETILKLKLEITQLENKIRTIEIDKNSYFKWLYLQIIVKEKRLTLPIYYKYILEENEANFRKNMATFIQSERRSPEIIKRQMTKNLTKKKPIERKPTRNSFFDNANNIINQGDNYFSQYKHLSKKEVLRIREYIYNPIFNSADEFLDMFTKIKNNTIKHLHEYSHLQDEIWELKNERNIFQNEQLKELESTEKYIEEKNKELEIQKSKKGSLKKEIHELKHVIKNILKKKNNNKEKRDFIKKQSIFELPKYIKKPKSNLKDSIENVYQTCKQVNIKIEDPDNENLIKKSKQNVMLDKLFEIEEVIDYLLNKIHYYRSIQTYEDYKKIRSNIDKMHMKENARKQREEYNEKYNLLKKQVEERNNIIYFLTRPFHNFINFSKKKNISSNFKKGNLTEPTFKDYMYDIINSNDSSNESEDVLD